MPRVDWDGLETVLEATAGVDVAWVFGSARDGDVREGGDLDIGILWDGIPTLMGLADLRARLQLKLKIDDLDLVVLNEASSITRFEAISGRAVLCRDLHRRAEFASLTAREYEDDMAFLESGLRQSVDAGRVHLADGA